MSTDSRIFLAEARQQYHNDAVTHAVADLVTRVLNEAHHEDDGMSLSRHEQQMVRMAASMALMFRETDPETGQPMILSKMREAALAQKATLDAMMKAPPLLPNGLPRDLT